MNFDIDSNFDIDFYLNLNFDFELNFEIDLNFVIDFDLNFVVDFDLNFVLNLNLDLDLDLNFDFDLTSYCSALYNSGQFNLIGENKTGIYIFSYKASLLRGGKKGVHCYVGVSTITKRDSLCQIWSFGKAIGACRQRVIISPQCAPFADSARR